MDTHEIKLSLHDLINETDDPEILQSIHVLLKRLLAFSPKNVAGYEPDGTAVSDEELVSSVLESREDVQRGNFYTLEAMKAQLGND